MAKGKAKLAAAAQPRASSSSSKQGDSDFIPERTRGYQMEMFQESLKRNIIVAVGKETL